MVYFFVSEDGVARAERALPVGSTAAVLLLVGLCLGIAEPAAAWTCYCDGCYMDHDDTFITSTLPDSELCTAPPYDLEARKMYCHYPNACMDAGYECVANSITCEEQ
jgi:hypothetical protein